MHQNSKTFKEGNKLAVEYFAEVVPMLPYSVDIAVGKKYLG